MLIVVFVVTANNVNPFCLGDVCVKGIELTTRGAKTTWSEIFVFSIKLMKSVVSFRYDSRFCAIGCNSVSTKLKKHSAAGPLLPETTGLPTGILLCIFVSV